MNQTILARFYRYQQLLIESAAVAQFTVVKENVTKSDGRIRIRARLMDGGLLELAEYVAVDPNGVTTDRTYAFHWQDADQQLVMRWDNVKHFPDLSNAPHHIHQTDGTVTGNFNTPTLETVLVEIEAALLA